MANDDRLVELMPEMFIRQDKMVGEQVQTNQALVKMQAEISKLNLLSAENNRAILKLANQMEHFLDLEPRVKKLESAVFK